MAVDPGALGRRVAELREAAGINQATAARRAGVTPAYWAAIESAAPQGRNRQPSVPRVPVIRSIADAIDDDRVELLRLAGYDDDAAIEEARQARVQRGFTMDASGVDLEELRRTDPEAYAAIENMARVALDRARQRSTE